MHRSLLSTQAVRVGNSGCVTCGQLGSAVLHDEIWTHDEEHIVRFVDIWTTVAILQGTVWIIGLAAETSTRAVECSSVSVARRARWVVSWLGRMIMRQWQIDVRYGRACRQPEFGCCAKRSFNHVRPTAGCKVVRDGEILFQSEQSRCLRPAAGGKFEPHLTNQRRSLNPEVVLRTTAEDLRAHGMSDFPVSLRFRLRQEKPVADQD